MEKAFHQQNRQELYSLLPQNSLLLLFSGHAPRKTGDEDYPFFADRSFAYYTGVEQADSVLTAVKGSGSVSETLFMLPPDALLERWNGRRLRPEEAEARSAVADFRHNTGFVPYLEGLIADGLTTVCLDFDRRRIDEQPVRQAYRLAAWLRKNYPFVRLENVHGLIANQRTIKMPSAVMVSA